VDGYIRDLKRGNKAAEEYIDKENQMLQRKVDELDQSYVRSQHEAFELREALRKQKKLLGRVPQEVLEAVQVKHERKER